MRRLSVGRDHSLLSGKTELGISSSSGRPYVSLKTYAENKNILWDEAPSCVSQFDMRVRSESSNEIDICCIAYR